MKILLVSDEECLYLWDYYRPGRLDGIDLILSCGDLNAEYLSFLVTMGRAPVLYVHGNHDGGYDKHPPEGCTYIIITSNFPHLCEGVIPRRCYYGFVRRKS